MKWLSSIFITLLLAGVSSAQTTHSSTFTWIASTGATGYNMYMSSGTCTGTFNKLNTAPITVLTFTDTGQADGEVRCYRLTALNGATAESQPSGTLLVTTPIITAGPAVVLPPGGIKFSVQ